MTSFNYGRPCRDPDEPTGLRPIRLDAAHRWFFVLSDIKERFARAMEAMDRAIWDAQDCPVGPVSKNGHHPTKERET